MNDTEAELNYWRTVAAYLASCHAATAEYDGHLASTSQSRRKRLALVCRTAAQMMRPYGWNESKRADPEDSRARCEEAAEALLNPPHQTGIEPK
jgi:hypothetical protein